MPSRHDEPEPQLSDQPPHHPHAEKAIVSLLLQHPAAYATIATLLVASDFYAFSHRVIFDAVAQMHHAGRPVTEESVRVELSAWAQRSTNSHAYDFPIGETGKLAHQAYKLTDLQGYAHQVKDASVRRDIQRLGRELQTMATDQSKTASLIAASVSDELHRKLATAESGLVSIDKLLGPVGAELEERSRRSDHFRGVRTSFPTLDAILQGYQPEQYYLLAAYSSVGKTALALATIRGGLDAHPDLQTVYYSPEMSDFAIGTRMLSTESGIDLDKLRAAYLDGHWDDVAAAASVLGSYRKRLYVNTRRVSIDDIATECRALASRHPEKRRMVVIDYIQLVGAGRYERLKEYQQFRSISREFAGLGKELRCPVLVFAQLNGDEMERPPDFRPWRRDLRDAKAMADDARAVILMSRPWVHRKNDAAYRRCFLRLIIDKNSEGDASESVDLHYRENTQTIVEEECGMDCPTHSEGPPFPTKGMKKAKKPASDVQKALLKAEED